MSKDGQNHLQDDRRAVWDARLHRAYWRSTGTRYFYLKRIRAAGFALGSVLVLAGCLGVGHSRSSIYQFFSLGVAAFGMSVPLAMWRRAQLRAEREVPRHASAGSPLRYAVRVTNMRPRAIARAWLQETLPDPRPSEEEFVKLREPGEDDRNDFDRRFAWFRWQWLVARKRIFEGGETDVELRLEPGESKRMIMEITPLRRGVIRLRIYGCACRTPWACSSLSCAWRHLRRV